MTGSGATVPESLTRAVLAVVALIAVLVTAMVSPVPARAQGADGFPGLEAGQRVYDETGTSLTPDQVADLEQRLADLKSIGADAIVYVRALDATPDETLDQVEALQQAWVQTSGADQDTAAAIVINRNPTDPEDARAGIYVGSTFDDGNVPRDEQRAIVNQALIPPLRDGDVHASLAAGLDRLESSIRFGPPQGAFEAWAAEAGSSWFPWLGVGLAMAGFAAARALFQRRQTTTLPEQPPTISRPGNLTPALAGALANGSPQASAVPATLLDLAARDAVDIEPESEGGTFSKPAIQVRLVDRRLVSDDVEAALWGELERRADEGVVSSKNLNKVAADSKAVRQAVERQMRDQGWRDADAGGNKAGLMMIFVFAVVLLVFTAVVAAVGEQWLPVVAIAALAALAVTAMVMYSDYSGLSRQGQEAAIPWKAYREGLKRAAKDDAVALDLDAVLADSVAMNLGSAMSDRLKEANESGRALRAFTSPAGASYTSFPWWVAFSGGFSTTSGSTGTGTVSGGGAGGGGGAAGST